MENRGGEQQPTVDLGKIQTPFFFFDRVDTENKGLFSKIKLISFFFYQKLLEEDRESERR